MIEDPDKIHMLPTTYLLDWAIAASPVTITWLSQSLKERSEFKANYDRCQARSNNQAKLIEELKLEISRIRLVNGSMDR